MIENAKKIIRTDINLHQTRVSFKTHAIKLFLWMWHFQFKRKSGKINKDNL